MCELEMKLLDWRTLPTGATLQPGDQQLNLQTGKWEYISCGMVDRRVHEFRREKSAFEESQNLEAALKFVKSEIKKRRK